MSESTSNAFCFFVIIQLAISFAKSAQSVLSYNWAFLLHILLDPSLSFPQMCAIVSSAVDEVSVMANGSELASACVLA